MRRGARIRALIWGLSLGGVSAVHAQGAGYSRPVEVAPGWARLELTPEVLARARTDRADVRLRAGASELGYAVEGELPASGLELGLIDVVSVEGRRTEALLDRGERPGLASCLALELEGSEPFLKPLELEASSDGVHFARLASGSLFRTERVAANVLCFSPSDHRRLRLVLDDRNSPPVRPLRARLFGEVPRPSARPLLLSFARLPAERGSSDERYSLDLPSRNLPLRALGLRPGPGAGAFSRRVQVFERVLLRGELSQRLVAEGRVERTVAGLERLELPLGPSAGVTLEVVIEGAGAPLGLEAIEGLLEPPVLLFQAPADGSVTLEYGDEGATTPIYDTARILREGRPSSWNTATLGPERAARSSAPPATLVPRGAPLASSEFGWAYPLTLPPTSAPEQAAYLDVPRLVPGDARSLRLLDAEGRQVPFVRETRAKTVRLTVPSPSSEGSRRSFELTKPGERGTIRGVEVSARAPEYFSRRVEVIREGRDRRGVTRREPLVSVVWERRPGEAPRPLSLSFPGSGDARLELVVDDGDNAPLDIDSLALVSESTRLDFFYRSGDELRLVGEHPTLGPPDYDLALLAERLLAGSAVEVGWGAPLTSPSSSASPPRDSFWFWLALTAVGGALSVVLVRAVLSSPPQSPPPQSPPPQSPSQ